jgi:branched-chain amino acid transport system substrate-binding protein
VAIQNLKETDMTTRRNALKATAVAAGLSALGMPFRALAQGNELVVGAAPPITGVFAFAGVGLNNGLSDYCDWHNETKGGIAGRRLRYVAEDSGYRMDQAMAVFKKIMAAHRPPVFYGDSTAWAKAAASEVRQLGSTMTCSPSYASELADPRNVPYYFMAGPTYAAMCEILLEYINRQGSGGTKPTVDIVYSDTEFGRDPIPAAKAHAQKLGLNVVQEIVTRPGSADVSAEVARLRRARPDYVIFHGYVLAPIPEFIRQLREAGLTNTRFMGTIWSMDTSTAEAMGPTGEGWMGGMPYRYGYDTQGAPMMQTMNDFAKKKRPNTNFVNTFYTHGWLVGMSFAEIMERCLKDNKPLTGENMKVALESMTNWDTGGITGQPVDYRGHQIAAGRIYRFDATKKQFEPASDWIKTA